MHTVELLGDGRWRVIFVAAGVPSYVIETYPTKDEAWMWCSYLNGGLPPLGYTMMVQNVGL